MKKVKQTIAWLSVSGLLFNACTSGDSQAGEGIIKLMITGEEAAKTGFPVALEDHDHGEEDDHGEEEVLEFVDGWQVKWDAYVISLGNFSLANSEGESAIEEMRAYVVDLHQGDPELATFADLPARRWDRFGFAITPPAGDIANVNVDESIVNEMKVNNYTYWIKGIASKGDQMVTFAWGIQAPTENNDCTNGLDDTQGIVVQTGKTETHEITIHLEHMFWTSLGSEINEMRFDAIAAMADENGHVSWDALAQQNLADLKNADGEPLTDENGNPVIYNPGSANLPKNNLQEFIRFSMKSQAHFNGSGLCTITS